jgi:hypothetical protein
MRRVITASLIAVVVIAACVTATTIRRPENGTPEAAADSFLRQVRSGKFEKSFSPLRPDGVNNETEVREKSYRPLWFWRLSDQRGTEDERRFHYNVIRGWVPIPSPVWVTVRNRDGRWQVTRFEAWY